MVVHGEIYQGLKLYFGNDLTKPVLWSDILNSTIQKLSKCGQTLARNSWKRQMSDHNFRFCQYIIYDMYLPHPCTVVEYIARSMVTLS